MTMIFNGSQPSAKLSIGQNSLDGWKVIICAKLGQSRPVAGVALDEMDHRTKNSHENHKKTYKSTEKYEKTLNYLENPRNQPETMKNHEANLKNHQKKLRH